MFKNFALSGSGVLLLATAIINSVACSSMPINKITCPEYSSNLSAPFQTLCGLSGIPKLDKNLSDTVSYTVDANINAVSALFNNCYWGIQEPWKLSITTLKTFITLTRCINNLTPLIDILCKELISTVRNQKFTEEKNVKEKALGLMDDLLICETLWQSQHNPNWAISLRLKLNATEEKKLYGSLYKGVYKHAYEQLLKNGMTNKEFVFDENSFKTIVNQTPESYFKHDWLCYLVQFGILRGSSIIKGTERVTVNSVLSSINEIIALKNQCAKRINLLNHNAVGLADDIITLFEQSSGFKNVISSINKIAQKEILKIDHNDIEYLIFLCNYCELQLSVAKKKLNSVDDVINIWKDLTAGNTKKLAQEHLMNLRLIMSISSIAALEYGIELNNKNIKNILHVFNQIQQINKKLFGIGIDLLSCSHFASHMLKNNITTDAFLNKMIAIKKGLPNTSSKALNCLTILSCLADSNDFIKKLGSKIELYTSLEQLVGKSIDTGQVVMNFLSYVMHGNLKRFIETHDKVKNYFSKNNNLKNFYPNKNTDTAFYLYATMYKCKIGSPATYFPSDKFNNREELLKILDSIDTEKNNVSNTDNSIINSSNTAKQTDKTVTNVYVQQPTKKNEKSVTNNKTPLPDTHKQPQKTKTLEKIPETSEKNNDTKNVIHIIKKVRKTK